MQMNKSLARPPFSIVYNLVVKLQEGVGQGAKAMHLDYLGCDPELCGEAGTFLFEALEAE